MNNTVKILMLVSIFSLFLFGHTSVFANEMSKGEVGTMSQPMGWETFEASWLIGHQVYSPYGGELGQIEDLMIDRTDGHIALVILSGARGFGTEFVAAPFGALERTGEDAFRLNFDAQYDSNPYSFQNPTTPYDNPYDDPYAYQLYRHRTIVGLSKIPSTIDPLWADSVYQFYGQTPYWTEGTTPHPDIVSYRTARPSIFQALFRAKTAPVLMGATVQSEDGKVAARTDDLVIDSRDGRVAFLVVDRVPGRGNAEVAVPFGELSMKGDTFVLNTTGDRLASAPRFDEYGDTNNMEWAESVYRFFGQTPYWTEGGTR